MGATARPGPANLLKVRAVTGVYTLTTTLRSDIHHGSRFQLLLPEHQPSAGLVLFCAAHRGDCKMNGIVLRYISIS